MAWIRCWRRPCSAWNALHAWATLITKPITEERTLEAQQLLHKALELDPNSALAWTAMARVQLNDLAAIELAAHGIESQSLAALLGGLAGGGAEDLRWAAALPVALGLAALCFASGPFRRSVRDIVAGLVLGLLVTAGWCATGVLGADDFEPERLASLTFVAPVGDSVLYLMTFTGSRLDFGIAVVGGVVLGAFASARLSGCTWIPSAIRPAASPPMPSAAPTSPGSRLPSWLMALKR